VANIRISGTTNYDGLYTITVIDVDNFYFTDTWVANDATGWWGKDTEGRNNTALGYAAGDNLTTGSNNIIIGANIDAPLATGDNQLNIGNAIYGNLSNGYVGIGVTDPDTMLEVFGSTGLKISFDATDNTTLVTDTNGDLTITPSGDEVILPTGKNLKLGDTVLTEQNVIDLLALLA
jgi:hypothetical protein